MRWIPRTLRARLLLAVLAVEVLAFAAILPVTLNLIERTAAQLNQQRLSESIALLTTAVAQPIFNRDISQLERLISRMVSTKGLQCIEVYNGEGRLLISVDAPNAPKVPVPGTTEDVTELVRLGGRTVGSIKLVVSETYLQEARRQAIALIVTLAGAAILLSLLALWLIALLLTRNLSALRRAAESAGGGDLSVRAQVHGQDEVATAARELNRMLAGLQRAGELLSVSQARFRDLVEGSLQGVMVFGSDWNVLFANQAAADIYGYDNPEQLLALSSSNVLVAPGDRDRLSEYNAARLGGDQRPLRYEHQALHKDGRIIWLDTYVRVVTWEGQPAVQSTLVDVTEEKEAREELRRSEENFRRLMEDSALSTIIFDKDWRPVFLNSAAARLFGYASPEAMLTAVSNGADLVAEEDRAMLSAYRKQRLVGESVPSRYEFRAVRCDGRTLWLQNMVSIVLWEGQRASMSISIDITEHKLREEELRQAQKMEAVGQLTGGVAHDFNNLLTIIIGNLELLKRHLGQGERPQDLLRSAHEAAIRGSTLTQRLLAFSRRQALQPETVDVNRLVVDMSDLLRRTLGESVEVHTVLPDELWPALVDPNQLENALLNLAINARDAMPEGGRLTIATANVRLDGQYAALHEDVVPGPYVLLSVSDTGEGMTAEVQARAFEPFFTTKEIGRGSGLGLSMVYGFIKQSHGHVKIDSEHGRGSTLRMYLPPMTTLVDGAAQPMLQAASPLGRGERILIVERERTAGELAAAMLTGLGYAPLRAHDARSALQALTEHGDISLLLTSLALTGGMSGPELAQAARQQRPDLKVLYTVGRIEHARFHDGRGETAAELLEKPFRVETLARKVRAALDGSAAQPAESDRPHVSG